MRENHLCLNIINQIIFFDLIKKEDCHESIKKRLP